MIHLHVGLIPYLNMVPFHAGFGPALLAEGDVHASFDRVSPRALGRKAAESRLDAGAMSLVDYLALPGRFERILPFGIGVKRAAQSVLLFSRKPLQDFSGFCAVTEETSTSFRLLQVLLERRYGRAGVSYGRVQSATLFDGDADGLLLIGDEALNAQREGVRSFPVVTDLAEEWYLWKGTPFVFAVWAARKDLPQAATRWLESQLAASLEKGPAAWAHAATRIGISCRLPQEARAAYWQGFEYRLTAAHEASIEVFSREQELLCSNV